MSDTGRDESRNDELSRLAARNAQDPFREFLHLVVRTRKYWLVPIIVALLFAGLLVTAGGSSLAPLIYALF
jgi:hypothetical protein